MDVFSWLHLSDLHWGRADQKDSWPEIRHRLFESLRHLHNKCGPWDAVFFTGDLVQRGQDFEQMEQDVLEPLYKELEQFGSRPILLAVPGNHDLKRSTEKMAEPTVRVLTTQGGFHNIRNEFWGDRDSPYGKVINEVFTNYTYWWRAWRSRADQSINDGLLPGDFSTTLTTRGGHRIGVLGLNTSFLQLTEGPYEKRLACGIQQFNAACDGDGPSWAQQHDACILLTHHGPDWLDAPWKREYAEINPAGRFVIHLFGHMHETAMRGTSQGGGGIVRHWQGMSLFGLEHFHSRNGQETRLHGYGAGSLQFQGEAVQLRQWPQQATFDTTNGWRFIRDEEKCVLEDDGGTLEVINLPSKTKRVARAPAPNVPATIREATSATAGSCDGRVAMVCADMWSDAAVASPLWRSEAASWNGSTEMFKHEVAKLAAACWTEHHSVKTAMPMNPWWDEHFPVRVLQRLECLALRPTPVDLSDAEVSLLIVVPFVREAVLASAVRFSLPFGPCSLQSSTAPDGIRRILEQGHQRSPNMVRRARRLKEKGDEVGHHAIATWLMFRAIIRAAETWLEPPFGFISAELQDAIQEATENSVHVVRETLSPARVLELAQCIHADPERIERTDRPNALRRSVSVASSSAEERDVRERLLGYLLCLAGWMAIDVRSLDEVLIEHIGLSDPIAPAHVVNLLRASAWPSSRGQRVLRVACDHPAIDYALHDHVCRADNVLVRVHRKVHDKEDGLEVLSNLPSRFAGDDITPSSPSAGSLPYQIPHLRFHLANDEIRELLMGESLYGDPCAAIRELYQNALDACRYRAARIEYLKRRRPGFVHSWEGRIIFRQGKDESGRHFIECEDNGVGMGRQQLDECFARAGRRFIDMPEFIEEQSEWIRCDPPIRLYPNAQFGIGVFSYLLLADELLVESCRFLRDGSMGRRLLARVSGSGGLFRVEEVLGRMKDAGTRVRLYLSTTSWNGQAISCLAKLSEILWVAEFGTEAIEEGKTLSWNSGELNCPRLRTGEYVNAGDEDVWWSSQNGQILVDGLAIGTSPYNFCIANLRGPRRPHLMLNRSAIVPHDGPSPEWDKGFVDTVLAQGARYLRTWTGLTLAWLWRVAQANWKLAEKIVDELCLENCMIRIDVHRFGDATVALQEIGCFGGDEVLLNDLASMQVSDYGPDMCHGMVPEWLVPWRLALWECKGLPVPDRVWQTFRRPDGALSLPRLVPGDSLVLSKSLGRHDWLDGEVPISHLVRAAAKMEEPIERIIVRLERFAIFGISLPNVDGAVLARFSVNSEDIVALSQTCHEGGACLDDRVSSAHMIRVAAKLGKPLCHVIARFREYERLGIKLPESTLNDARVTDAPVRREYLGALSHDLSEGGKSLADELSAVHLVYIAGKSKRSLALVIADLECFSEIGLRLPTIRDRAQLDFVPSENDLFALSERLDGHTPLSDDRVSSSHIVRIAFKLRKPLATVVADLERFAPLGVCMPQVDGSDLADLIVTPEDAISMSQDRRNWGASIGDRVPPAHLFLISSELNDSLGNTFRRLSRFQCLGLRVPDVDLGSAASLRKMVHEDVVALSQNCDGQWPWLDEVVTREHVLCVAQAIHESPEEVVKRLRSFVCLGLTVPAGEWEEWDK